MPVKVTDNTVLDAALNEIRDNCNLMTLCEFLPASFAEANTLKGSGGKRLAGVAVDTGDFTAAADGSPDGRDIDVAQQTGVTGDAAGCGSYVALLDTVNSVLLHAVPETEEHGGTAQAGGASTITLASGASAVDDNYNGFVLEIESGTGAGQVKKISDYVGSTKVATVDSAWSTNPDATSVYTIYGRPVLVSDSITIGGFTIRFADPT